MRISQALRASVLRLGNISWPKALAIQQSLANQRVSGLIQDTLVHCEHPPTYTGGRRIEMTEAERERLVRLGAEVYESKRGGQVTYHGPGQLVTYSICDVAALGGVRCFIHKIEEALIRTCAEFGLEATRNEHTGVWLGDNKVAAIGVQVTRGVSYHGMAINCNTDLDWYNHIVPCGITDKGVTSLSQAKGKQVTIDDVRPILEAQLLDVFYNNPTPQCTTP
eukprot:m.73632 g.73632  ORF g.73632 m.73632 type:complete len:222 (+) comp12371_c1_seq1:267-932(+)